MTYYYTEILTTVIFTPVFLEQVIDFSAWMTIITATPVHYISIMYISIIFL